MKFNDIDISTKEGKMLAIAVGIIMFLHPDKDPDEITDIIHTALVETEKANEENNQDNNI